MDALTQTLGRAKTEIISGNPQKALEEIENFTDILAGSTLTNNERDGLELCMAELRQLTEAAQSGTQRAVEQIRAIIDAARSLQTYDSGGNLHISRIEQQSIRRF